MDRTFDVRSSARPAFRAAIVFGVWAVLWFSVLFALAPSAVHAAGV
jgi:type IV secretory pathway component VirB8